MIKVWDPVVRVFHWGLVLFFAIAWVSSEGFDTLHFYTGYIAAALIAIRLLWGLVGSRYARFTQFVKGPASVIAYLKAMLNGSEKRYLGHNPAGGAMIIALILAVAATVASGWMSIQPQYEHWKVIEEVHNAVASLTMVLIILHVAGVVLASLRHRENLSRAMVTGQKRGPESGDVA